MSDVAGASAENVPGAPVAAGIPTEIAARSPWQLFWSRFREDRLAMVSLWFLVFLALVAIFAPLIVDILGPARPERKDRGARDLFGTATGPEHRPPAGRGPKRTRRPLASHLRRSRLAPRRRRRDRPGLDRRDRLRPRRRYFRGWADSIVSRICRCPARDPLPAAGDRPRRLLLVRRRLPWRCDPARPRRRHLRDLRHELDVHRPCRPRPGALPAREGVRARLTLARRLTPADHLPRDPPQPRRARSSSTRPS